MSRLPAAVFALAALFAAGGCRGTERAAVPAAPVVATDQSAAPPAPLAAPAPPASSSWQPIARLPKPLITKAIAAVDGTLYFFSGLYAEGPTNDVTAYDLKTRRWSARAPMPQAQYNQDAIALDGMIYMAGGCLRADCASPSSAAYAYDPKQDFWTVLPPLPEKVFDALSAAIGGRFVVIGGVSHGTTSRRVYAFSPRANSWSRLADLPGPRSHAAGAMFGGKFFLVGGCKGGIADRYCDEIADDVFVYDPGADAWTAGPPLPSPVFGHGAAVDGGKLIVAGGRADLSPGANGPTFTLSSAAAGWLRGPDLLRPRFGARMFPLSRGVGLFGPNATNNPHDLVEGLGAPGPYVDPGEPTAFASKTVPPRAHAQPRAAAPFDPDGPENLPPASAARPRAHAVVIGIERYRQNLPAADFAASDAKLTAEYFRRVLGVPDRNLAFLGDENATKSDFEKYFERWLPNRVEKGDEVYVYFSGHGAPNAKTGEAYLVPYDADPTYIEQTGYPLKRMYEQLAKLPAERVTVVLDSCFSGAGGRSVLAEGARPLVSVVRSEAPRGITVLSASAADQISNSYREKRHGLFTYFFLKGLREKRGDIRAAYDYSRLEVSRVARREFNSDQDPQWSGGK